MATRPQAQPPSARDRIDEGPPGDDVPETDPLKPLGVPKGYTVAQPDKQVRVEGRGWMGVAQPDMPARYYEDDIWAPAATGPESIAELQIQMAQLDILTSDFQLGVWDKNSRAAFKGLLEFSNGSGLTWQEAMGQYGGYVDQGARRAGSRGAGGGGGRRSGSGGAGRAPLAIRQTNPDDLKALADDVAQNTIHRRLTEAEKQKFVQGFHGMEATEQRQAYSAQMTGGTVTQGPSPQTAAETMIRKQAPVEAGGAGIANAADTIMSMFTGGV